MEKGEMRVEANISVSSGDKLGTKVEVKNLNSFKAVEKAIIYERNRQIEILERGENVIQETRGFDENTGETFSQRAKEDSHDYRYFPDPDLPKLFINEIPDFSLEVLRKTLPELPSQKRDRYKKTYNLKDTDIEIYIRSVNWSNFFEAVANKQSDNNLIILSSNYITSELKKEIDVNEFCEVIKMIGDGEISSKGAKEILKELQMRGGNARSIAIEKNVIQISDHITLTQWVEEVIKEENKDAPIQYLVGQVIKKSQGKANPKIVFEIMTQKKA
jgi:aspartyl-tRNA(Asn)/glutamyl-tRNA(Gln) amidotransferase subunit B